MELLETPHKSSPNLCRKQIKVKLKLLHVIIRFFIIYHFGMDNGVEYSHQVYAGSRPRKNLVGLTFYKMPHATKLVLPESMM